MRGKGPGSVSYFRESLLADVDALALNGGIHAIASESLGMRFPFAIYYRVEANVVPVRAILDCRREPSWIRRRVADVQDD